MRPPDGPRPSEGGLPFVDDHHTLVAAPREVVWSALRAWVDASFTEGAGGRLSRLLGADPPSGFAVSGLVPHRRLRLSGRHRFATYALVFELEEVTPGHTSLRALTYARFPGVRGRVYRALVIGSRAHLLVTRRLLRRIRGLATAGA